MDKKTKSIGGLLIPAGIFVGLGVGFAFMQVWIVMGVFLGLGAGFLGMFIYEASRKR
ncbi:MAG: hypothetical protein ABIH63_01845 [archaeon]